MWCPSCRADVAAELSMDNRRLLCARCQSELGIAAGISTNSGTTSRNQEMERDARDLLARWSAQRMLENPLSAGASTAAGKPAASVEIPGSKPDLRFDSPHLPIPMPSASLLAALKDQSFTLPMDRTDASHSQQPRAPRLEESTMSKPEQSQSPEPAVAAADNPPAVSQEELMREYAAPKIRIRSHWTTILGQLAAFSGIGLLTCGSSLVVWSLFGGPTNYMPTGWIAVVIGQMLLLLGIVTLISNGLDQTTREVAWRVDHLAEEIHHMGLALDDLEAEHRNARLGVSRPRNDQANSREAA